MDSTHEVSRSGKPASAIAGAASHGEGHNRSRRFCQFDWRCSIRRDPSTRPFWRFGAVTFPESVVRGRNSSDAADDGTPSPQENALLAAQLIHQTSENLSRHLSETYWISDRSRLLPKTAERLGGGLTIWNFSRIFLCLQSRPARTIVGAKIEPWRQHYG